MVYDPRAVERYYDAIGFGEYERHDKSPEMRVKFELHVACLREFVAPGARVLEVGPGPGRFTEILAEMGCGITVVDLSREQLRLNRERAHEKGYAASIEAWVAADMCDLSGLGEARFDCVIAFGGPLSYVLDRRERALKECLARLEPSGRLLLSVMSKWGTIHAFLNDVAGLPRAEIEALVRTGDVTPETTPRAASDGHHFHMFTSEELRELLESSSLSVEFMSASNALSTRWGELLEDEGVFEAVLELEAEGARSSGALDAGTHILAVATRSG